MAPSYKQIIHLAFNSIQKAIRILDTTEESLETAETNTVTVSTTVLGIADFFQLNGKERKATFQVVDAGPINVNSLVAPTAGGAEGSLKASLEDIVVVTGRKDIERFRTVLATGGSDAEVRAVLYRRL